MSNANQDKNRQTGRTTRQMVNAPEGAVYVWVSADLDYPRHLAHRLGRDDLRIVDSKWLAREDATASTTYVVIDHATLRVRTNHVNAIWQGYRRLQAAGRLK